MSRKHFPYRTENIEAPTVDELRSLMAFGGKHAHGPWTMRFNEVTYCGGHFGFKVPFKTECEDAIRYAVACANAMPGILDKLEAAHARGHAGGYAKATADVVAWLRAQESTYDAITDKLEEGSKQYQYNVGRFHGYQHAAEKFEQGRHGRGEHAKADKEP